MSERPERRGRQSAAASAGEVLGYALAWVASTLIFLFIGRWADARLGTDPLLTLIGAFVGGAAGFYSMYHHVVVEPRRQAERGEDRSEEEGA